MKIDDILTKTNQHLRRRLAANAAIDIRLARKRFVQMPRVSDGVAKKHYTILPGCRRLKRSVGVTIPRQLPVVVGEHGDPRSAILVETSEAGGRDGGGVQPAGKGQQWPAGR